MLRVDRLFFPPTKIQFVHPTGDWQEARYTLSNCFFAIGVSGMHPYASLIDVFERQGIVDERQKGTGLGALGALDSQRPNLLDFAGHCRYQPRPVAITRGNAPMFGRTEDSTARQAEPPAHRPFQ
ncbi:MAG: hypothetical protein J2P48_08580 [Alphaproteobacteria bacterium]|nr:hypothetical protein [Alphaproteobacteria bacterium]